jgi:hypothetical protein
MLPPPLPKPAEKGHRFAAWVNLVLPGAGLFMIGRRKQGLILAALFLACFFAALGLFLVSYARYLNMALSDDLMKGDNLERIGQVFPRTWLVGLAGAGGIIHLVSMGMLRAAKRGGVTGS